MDKRLGSGGGGLLSSLLLRRFIAFYIDLLIFVLLCCGINYVAGRLIFGSMDTPDAIWLILPVNLAGFFGFMLRDLLRPSIGKRLMGLRIVNADGTENVSAKKLILRHLTISVWPADIYTVIRTGGEARRGDQLMEIKVVSVW